MHPEVMLPYVVWLSFYLCVASSTFPYLLVSFRHLWTSCLLSTFASCFTSSIIHGHRWYPVIPSLVIGALGSERSSLVLCWCLDFIVVVALGLSSQILWAMLELQIYDYSLLLLLVFVLFLQKRYLKVRAFELQIDRLVLLLLWYHDEEG